MADPATSSAVRINSQNRIVPSLSKLCTPAEELLLLEFYCHSAGLNREIV